MEKERLLNYIDLFRKKSEKNKLVIFVGSGVSLNVEGMPSWSKIVQTMAKALNYSKCINCKKSNECSGNCPLIKEYSNDEFLKIPQYLYNQDKILYNKILKNIINNNTIDAPLSSVIFDINPVHIITTNYDNLLESSKNILRTQYRCIVKDKDLLNTDKNKYIIKMHGDLSELDTIVLKEDDYLNYSQNHILIELFIKSLFINHTIMFLGYSLSDYNIKLIISWINYMRLKNNISDDEKIGYIVLDSDNKEIDKNEINYFAQNNIEVININNITSVNEIPDSLSDVRGKRLYSFLRKIVDPSLEKGVESIQKAVKFMSQYSFISYSKLLNILNIRNYSIDDNKLHLMDNEDNKDYEILEKTISQDTTESKQLKQLFINSGILQIKDNNQNKRFNIGEFKENKIFDNKLFNLYLHNKYYELKILLNDCKCLIKKQFYTSLIEGYDGFKNFNYELDHDEFINLNINKQVAYLYNVESIKQSKGLFFDIKKIEKLIDNIEYSEERNLFSIYVDLYDNDIKENYYSKIAVLNRYLFYHFNNVIYRRFEHTDKFFKHFIEDVLCENSIIDYTYQLYRDKKCQLNFIEWDIITKFISTKDLNDLIIKNKIMKLNVDKNVILFLVECFENLCDYIVKSKYDENGYLKNFLVLLNIVLLLNLVDLDNNSKENIAYAIEKLFTNLNFIKFIFLRFCLWDICFLHIFSNLFQSLEFSHNIIIVKNIIHGIMGTGYKKIRNMNVEKFNLLRKIVMKFLCKDMNLQYKIIELVDKENEFKNKIVILRLVYKSIVDDNIRKKYIEFLSLNLNELTLYEICDFVYNNWLNPSKKEINSFLNYILKYREDKMIRVFSYSNSIEEKLESVCILYINDIIKDISKLKDLENKVPYLKFLFNQDTFDYTQVDFSDRIWVSFAKIPKYMKKFIKHKSDLIPKLKERVKNFNATENEKKILYCYLLKKDDLWKL